MCSTIIKKGEIMIEHIETIVNRINNKIRRAQQDVELLKTNSPSSTRALAKAEGRLDAYKHSAYIVNEVIKDIRDD